MAKKKKGFWEQMAWNWEWFGSDYIENVVCSCICVFWIAAFAALVKYLLS